MRGSVTHFNDATEEQLRAAIMLVASDEMFFGTYQHDTGTYDDANIRPVILCNDIFYPAADGETIDWVDCPELLHRVLAEGWPAAVKWVAEKRGISPMTKVQERMNAYTEAAKNTYGI